MKNAIHWECLLGMKTIQMIYLDTAIDQDLLSNLYTRKRKYYAVYSYVESGQILQNALITCCNMGFQVCHRGFGFRPELLRHFPHSGVGPRAERP